MNTNPTPENNGLLEQRASLEQLAATVRLKKRKVAEYKNAYLRGAVSYEELAQAGKELCDALFEYSKAKFPHIKPKRLPYQAVIR